MSFFATQNKNVWKASEHKSEALHWQIQLGLTSIFLRVSCDSAKHENCKSINLLSGFSPTLTYTTPHQNWPNLRGCFHCLTKKYHARDVFPAGWNKHLGSLTPKIFLRCNELILRHHLGVRVSALGENSAKSSIKNEQKNNKEEDVFVGAW